MMPIREERSGTRRGRELRQTVTAALALAVALFFLPLLAVRGEPLYTPEGTDASPEAGEGGSGALIKSGRS